jgi:hypothetical protein
MLAIKSKAGNYALRFGLIDSVLRKINLLFLIFNLAGIRQSFIFEGCEIYLKRVLRGCYSTKSEYKDKGR